MSINDELYDAIVFGEREVVVEQVQRAVDNDEDVVELLNGTMIPALREVGEQFSSGEVFVPEMLVSARAMQGGIDIIEPLLALSGHEPVALLSSGKIISVCYPIEVSTILNRQIITTLFLIRPLRVWGSGV